MKTLKNHFHAHTFLLAAAALVLLTHDQTTRAQTPSPTPFKSWTQVSVLVKNTVRAVKHDLEEMADEFPLQFAQFAEAAVDEDSLRYETARVHLGVEFRHPLAPRDARDLDATWRVYRLKDGKLLGVKSHASGLGGDGAPSFTRRAFGIIRAAEAQLLDHLGADTRGSTRDLDVTRYDGRLELDEFYRAEITYDRERWEWVTMPAPKVPYHHSGRIEWLNAGHFPRLFERPPGARVEVVFQVVGVKREFVAERHWRLTYVCRIGGVEGREPPRAEHLTLVAACRRVRATGKRNPGLYFTFDVRRVVAGSFNAKEFTIELTSGTGADELLRAMGGEDFGQREGACDASKAVELTFEVTDTERPPRGPGVLQEFRVIE